MLHKQLVIYSAIEQM